MDPERRAGKYGKWTDTGTAWWQTAQVRGYGQYCPVAKAAEVLGERWTLLIVRDLITGAHRFTDLHNGLPGISRTLLSERLRRLESDGLVERRRSNGGRGEYWLTPLGRDLEPAVMAIGEWAVRNYSHEPRSDELHSDVLMLWIERNVRPDAFPPERFVARFEFRGSRPPRSWLVVEDRAPSVCHDDPGFEADIVISSDLRTLHRVFAGRLALSAAMRDSSLTLEGSTQQRRLFTRWFGVSPFAPEERKALAG
jgi:DNA-binding HxlR family transcriptional regulator